MRWVIFNQKGGVGKTTITCNLAAVSATEGKRTLVVDLDIQGNSTHYLTGRKFTDPDATIAAFFREQLSLNPFAKSTQDLAHTIHATPFPNLSVLPSHPELDGLMSRLESRHKIYKLRELLEKLGGFDVIYMDTPPVMNFYSLSALIAAQNCLIPFDCDAFSRDALHTLMGAIGEVRSDHNPGLKVRGIVVNQYQGRARLPQQQVDQLVEEGHPVLATKISPSIKVRESHSAAKPMVYLDPVHKLTEEFKSLYHEVQGT